MTKLIAGNLIHVGACGIRVTISPGKRDQKVPCAEKAIHQVKRILLTLVRTYIFQDMFDCVHKISLVQLFASGGGAAKGDLSNNAEIYSGGD